MGFGSLRESTTTGVGRYPTLRCSSSSKTGGYGGTGATTRSLSRLRNGEQSGSSGWSSKVHAHRNFRELRKPEVQLWRVHHGQPSGSVKLHSWVTTLGQQGTEVQSGSSSNLGCMSPIKASGYSRLASSSRQ